MVNILFDFLNIMALQMDSFSHFSALILIYVNLNESIHYFHKVILSHCLLFIFTDIFHLLPGI